jgi:hypothetical protein
MDSPISFPHVFITPRTLPDGYFETQVSVDGDPHCLRVQAGNYRSELDTLAAFKGTLTKETQARIRACFRNRKKDDFSLEGAFEPPA